VLGNTFMTTYGHTALHLPSYYPDLNQIEMIWMQVKQWVRSTKVTFKIEDAKLFCEQRLGEMGEKE
jgi:transposase